MAAVQVVSFRCVLKDNLGRVISSTYNQNVLTAFPGEDKHLEVLVNELSNLQKGEKRRIFLRAEQAYGYYLPQLVITRCFDDLALNGPLHLGEKVIYETEGERRSYRVTELSGDSVTLDANHPLAGQDLVFEIEATDARAATQEEIEAVKASKLPNSLH